MACALPGADLFRCRADPRHRRSATALQQRLGIAARKYYGDRSMGVVDETYMSLEVPANTADPAATPLTLKFADDDHRRIRRVRVFIDNNPSPLVATFDFAGTPVTEINLSVRIDRFTSVRAIA